MSQQGRGILLFGLFFLAFLIWLWRQSPDTQPQRTAVELAAEVDQWLYDNGLESLQAHKEAAGVKSLEDLFSVDTSTLKVDSAIVSKFEAALPELELSLWLRKEGLLEYLPPLKTLGHSSLLVLCRMSVDQEEELIALSPAAAAASKQSFRSALQELREKDERCIKDRQSGWTVGSVLMYVLLVLLIGLAVGGIIVLIGTILVAAVLNVLAGIFAAIFHVVIYAVIGGLMSAIASAFTGGRVRINPPPPPRPPPIPRFSLWEVVGGMFRGVWNTLREMVSNGGGGAGGGGATGGPRRPRTGSGSAAGSSFSLGLYERLRGSYLDPGQCSVEWNHQDQTQVGASSVLTIKFVRRNGTPYELAASDSFSCRIVSNKGKAEIPHVVEPTPLPGNSALKVSFTAKVSGSYSIRLKVNNGLITKERTFLPGPVDSNKTVILDKTAVLVVTKGIYSSMKIIPKDSFGNEAKIEEKAVDIDIRKDSKDGVEVVHELVVYKNDFDMYELLIKLDNEGHYVGTVKYDGVRIGPPNFSIISLLEDKMQMVEKNVKKKNLNVWYEAFVPEKANKKVYCYISPRQLQVREYFMKIIHTRSFTCKVSPSTQIIFHSDAGRFTLDDGFQEPLTLMSAHREILGATFHKFVLKNIGGSEKFQDKQSFFFSNLREHHHRQSRSDKRIVVSRDDLLESARRATKNFSTSDWCKKFSIVFKGEEGLDWGGLSREFFQLICVHLFDPSNKLFMRFSDDNHQALVHPNHSGNCRPSFIKLKHFNFAGKIVGKCLYESCMGNTLLVKARFTRSFLAQLIGLRINYRYFDSDDPSLYTTKIQYILENDVADLGLVFAEEEFSTQGGPPTVIPLVENGEEKEVNEQNKSQYLNALAQYRLTKRVSEEIVHFLKGLNDIVPDNLLSIFNENELELLMCGMDTVRHEDLKEHAVVSGTSLTFQQTLSWFWVITSSFTQEEMAKLLQFVTGCSQLPPGGFKELNPRFTITSAPTRDRLPTAHTCFNQLCLPEYSSCEQFQTSLMTALNEGGEGFGLL